MLKAFNRYPLRHVKEIANKPVIVMFDVTQKPMFALGMMQTMCLEDIMPAEKKERKDFLIHFTNDFHYFFKPRKFSRHLQYFWKSTIDQRSIFIAFLMPFEPYNYAVTQKDIAKLENIVTQQYIEIEQHANEWVGDKPLCN